MIIDPTSPSVPFLFVTPDPAGEPEGGGQATATADPAGTDSTDEGASDLDRLRHALDRERKERKAAAAKAAQLEAQLKQADQINPQVIQEAIARAQQEEEKRRLIEEQTGIRLRELEGKYQEQLTKVTRDLQAAKEAAEREAVRVLAEKAFLSAKGSTDASTVDGKTPFDYIWLAFQGSFRADKQGLYVVDGDGDPVIDEETGKRLPAVKWFTRLRQDPVHGLHFQPEFGSGSGARSSRDGRVTNSKDLSKLSTSQLFREAFQRKPAA